MKRHYIVIGGLTLVVLGSTAMLFMQRRNQHVVNKDSSSQTPQPTLVPFTDSDSGVSFQHPTSFQRATSNEDREQATAIGPTMLIARLKHTDPPALVTVTKEQGLRAAASLSKQEPLGMLLSNAARAHPVRYPEYKLISEKRTKFHDKQAAELIFTYKGPASEIIKQRLTIIMQNEDTALYFATQGKATDFDVLDTSYFTPIVNTIKL